MLVTSALSFSQSNSPLSIYEGQNINSIQFTFKNQPTDSTLVKDLVTKIEGVFKIYPRTQFNSFLASFYISKINLMPTVERAVLDFAPASQGGVDLTVDVSLAIDTVNIQKHISMFRNISSFPVVYSSKNTFITLKAAAAEMLYTNNNAWFSVPKEMTASNPLATNPSGEGYSAWLEGFASVGVYAITKIVPKINLNIYGGVNYLASFSAGNELFTQKSRFYGDVEEAYFGFIGGGRTARGNSYRYNTLYGRKQFTLGDGWLIVNTSMNGDNRAALQLNPRWASKNVFQTGFVWDKLFIQGFRLEPNELDILTSQTVINGLDMELGNKDMMVIGLSYLNVPRSNLRYYMPDGTVHTRDGLSVFNLRFYKSAKPSVGGLFIKAEGGYQRNSHFDMSAWAYYGEAGWNFASKYGSPSFSYRYAYFSGDNPDTKSYNRWDALYTGGNGEQWVQGSNMYKIVQNSNEITHRFQAVFNPVRKVQMVGQVWFFYAPQKVNLGGNPALSMLKSRYYGTEFNLTLKYFHSRSWYFHMNTAYTLPGSAIKNALTKTENWFCLSLFARYSF